METKKRRSRMKRQPTGRCLALTPRDFAIFKLLERYRYLRSTFIHAFVGGTSETRFKERLGDLYHEGGYLNRPERQWETAHSRCMPVVYENSERAREVLAMHGRLAERCRHMPYGASGAGRQFAHSLMICEVLASIELATIMRPDLRFVAWPEILAKAPEATRASVSPLRSPFMTFPASGEKSRGPSTKRVIPDGLFGLEYLQSGRKSYRFFALEADLGTMPISRSDPRQTSCLEKILSYDELLKRGIHKTWLGVPNLLILLVVPSEARKGAMMSALPGELASCDAFLFKVRSELILPHGSCVQEPIDIGYWERSGRPAINFLSVAH